MKCLDNWDLFPPEMFKNIAFTIAKHAEPKFPTEGMRDWMVLKHFSSTKRYHN